MRTLNSCGAPVEEVNNALHFINSLNTINLSKLLTIYSIGYIEYYREQGIQIDITLCESLNVGKVIHLDATILPTSSLVIAYVDGYRQALNDHKKKISLYLTPTVEKLKHRSRFIQAVVEATLCITLSGVVSFYTLKTMLYIHFTVFK